MNVLRREGNGEYPWACRERFLVSPPRPILRAANMRITYDYGKIPVIHVVL